MYSCIDGTAVQKSKCSLVDSRVATGRTVGSERSLSRVSLGVGLSLFTFYTVRTGIGNANCDCNTTVTPPPSPLAPSPPPLPPSPPHCRAVAVLSLPSSLTPLSLCHTSRHSPSGQPTAVSCACSHLPPVCVCVHPRVQPSCRPVACTRSVQLEYSGITYRLARHVTAIRIPSQSMRWPAAGARGGSGYRGGGTYSCTAVDYNTHDKD